MRSTFRGSHSILGFAQPVRSRPPGDSEGTHYQSSAIGQPCSNDRLFFRIILNFRIRRVSVQTFTKSVYRHTEWPSLNGRTESPRLCHQTCDRGGFRKAMRYTLRGAGEFISPIRREVHPDRRCAWNNMPSKPRRFWSKSLGISSELSGQLARDCNP